MPTFQFEAMDATGAEIKDVIEAPTVPASRGRSASTRSPTWIGTGLTGWRREKLISWRVSEAPRWAAISMALAASRAD